MGLSDHLTCLLRNLYASKEGTVRTGHGTMNWFQIGKVQFSSITQSCLSLCDPMDCSTPGFPVHHQLPELAWTHVHWVGDALQPSHPLSSLSPPAFSLSQHQGLFHELAFASSGQGTGVSASILPMNIQGWFPLGLTGLVFLQSRDSRVFSRTTIQKQHFLGTQPSLFPTLKSEHDYKKKVHESR